MKRFWIALALTTLAAPLLMAQTTLPAMNQTNEQWQAKHDMALKYPTLAKFYSALKDEAGKRKSSSLPDWSGLWMAAGGGALFRPSPAGVGPKLTTAAAAAVKQGQEMNAKGVIYDDNLSECGPAGYPRWLQEPFLREFIVQPKQTLLINEQANEIRRIYTDGRGHPPEADQYPLAEGDSIGFWDGQKLVIHTNQLQERSMGRNQPTQSDKMETLEIWEKISPNTIAVDVWVTDPALYLEPWYMQKRYQQIPNPDNSLRIRYWDCTENSNNEVVKTPDGTTGFKDLSFMKSGEKSKN